MTLKPLARFRHFTTHHCVTGSLRHIYVYNDHEISEEMLLGLGAGVSFSYWHFKGQAPFLGGRGGIKPPMEELAGQRTGVVVQTQTTTSARKAEEALLKMLEGGQPVMIQCDMGFLPYFDFGGEEYHFGGHVVVVCGHDPATGEVLIADREEALHPVSMADLARARGSTHKPFPPKNLWYSFDFAGKRPPAGTEVQQAIREQAQSMLEPPIRNIGVKGIRKAAAAIPGWPDRLNAEELRFALFNTYIFISAVGGTGGGLFRYMFSRFLLEAAGILGDARLEESAGDFQQIGDRWEALGAWCRQTGEARDPVVDLHQCVEPLEQLANLEEAAWRKLGEIASP